jgi:heme/copper-type cytochrome/quinol oxidase subunit 2
MTRRFLGLMLITGAGLMLVPAVARLFAQEQPPTRREFSVRASEFRFTPETIEVTQNEIVKLTVSSTDTAYSFTIDEYRVSKRVPAGGSVTFEFRADRPGSFPFYSDMTSDPRHQKMRGQLIVRTR